MNEPWWDPRVWYAALGAALLLFLWTEYHLYTYLMDFHRAARDFRDEEFLNSLVRQTNGGPDQITQFCLRRLEIATCHERPRELIEACVSAGLFFTCIGALEILTVGASGATTAIVSTLFAAGHRKLWKFIQSEVRPRRKRLAADVCDYIDMHYRQPIVATLAKNQATKTETGNETTAMRMRECS